MFCSAVWIVIASAAKPLFQIGYSFRFKWPFFFFFFSKYQASTMYQTVLGVKNEWHKSLPWVHNSLGRQGGKQILAAMWLKTVTEEQINLPPLFPTLWEIC